MLSVRSATPADTPFVMATERIPDYVPILGQWEETKHRTEMTDPANAYFIGESMGKPQGFAIVQHLDDPMGNVLLRRVAMADPGRGLGREMMRLVAAAVFGRSEPHRLWLHVSPYNQRARSFYLRFGFVEEGIMREAYINNLGERVSPHLMSMLRSDWERQVSDAGSKTK
jgi:diamine N-acetyltransferase